MASTVASTMKVVYMRSRPASRTSSSPNRSARSASSAPSPPSRRSLSTGARRPQPPPVRRLGGDRAGRPTRHRILEPAQAPVYLGPPPAPSHAAPSRRRCPAKPYPHLADAPLSAKKTDKVDAVRPPDLTSCRKEVICSTSAANIEYLQND